jgi:nucleoredoxin
LLTHVHTHAPQEMKGFHALPYSERELKTSLSQKFGVQGIPTLVIVDSNGQLLNKNGRAIVENDPTGAEFPWAAKTSLEVLQAATFVDNKGGKFSFAERLAGKHVGLYFSASWCPPCQKFSPILSETYRKLAAAGKPFEIVFLSSDREKEAFDGYFGHLPFLAAAFEDRRTTSALSEIFDVEVCYVVLYYVMFFVPVWMELVGGLVSFFLFSLFAPFFSLFFFSHARWHTGHSDARGSGPAG